ncbi:MAG: ATP-binding protein [Geminicoccaceae bacterium]|nr:ATP-binding protein [Geminicoccaceae bacterium]
MTLPTLFDLCVPRGDVLQGTIAESDFAADLARVLKGEAPETYGDPVRFFANTHPTRGLRDLLRNVCLRLSGQGGQASSIFRLDTNYGGGKTHSLIALAHAAQGMRGVADVGEFVAPEILPQDPVRVAAFDGENADPVNGRPLPNGARAYTPWGEIAFALAGGEGFEAVRRSDERRVAPGADTIEDLFGGGPALILIDELSIYLRKLRGANRAEAGAQLNAFLSGLMKAVERSPRAALVFTLAVGRDDGRATDAYGAENEEIARVLAEAQSVSARKATNLNPTEEDETVKVLRRRLFGSIADEGAKAVIDAYKAVWQRHRDALPAADWDARVEALREGYPLHPALIEMLKEKTATLETFQRVRGMLRLLARTVAGVWAEKRHDAHAIHPHHVDLAREPIRQELITRLEQGRLAPALNADVASGGGGEPALAQQIDRECYGGMPPYASYVARTVFLHTLAGIDQIQGLTPEELRYAALAPGLDATFLDDARRRLVEGAAFLDDRAKAPLRFLQNPNLTQLIRRQERNVDPGEVRAQLDDRVRETFRGSVLNPVPFASGPHDVPDDDGDGDGRPYLAVMGYDAAEVAAENPIVPDLVERIYRTAGGGGGLRQNRNNVVFVVADAGRKEGMRQAVLRRLALDDMRRPERLQDLAEHQRDKVRELYQRSQQEAALAIQGAYRHVFYPSRQRLEGAAVDLAHTAVEHTGTAANPGDGQRQVVRVLQDNNKLRLPEDQPDAPAFVRDRTPLRKGRITTAELRAEFRRDPNLPMLVGDDVFRRGVQRGVEQGEYVYQSGALVWAKGEPFARVEIDGGAFVLTSAYALEHGIWPPPPAPPPPPPLPPPPGPGGKKEGEGGGEPPVVAPPPPSGEITAEAVLREALIRIFETARARRFTSLSTLQIRPFEAEDGFKLLGIVGTVAKAERRVTIEGEYETKDGSLLEMSFKGTTGDAGPVKDFLVAQMRAAADRNLAVTFDLAFEEGLPLAGDAAEAFAEKLCRFGAGTAFVAASAKGGA